MQPIQLFEPESSTYTYVLFDARTRDAIIIDAVDTMLERDLALLREHQLQLRWVIETHAHADHITSARALVEHTGARVAVPAGCGIEGAASQLQHGDTLSFGAEKISAFHTPGHTAGSMTFLWNNHAFTGDTLLIGGCGRTDFQSGSADALYSSLTEILFALPGDTIVWPGHDYKGQQHSTIAHERANNPRIAGKSRTEFIALMNALNLPKPRRIDEAVPANRSLGRRHDAGGGDDAPIAAEGYAGDLPVALAHEWWQQSQAVLVDVRSDAERAWVGFVPGAEIAAWKQWPTMAINEHFDEQLRAIAAKHPNKPLLMLCRSGVRSIPSSKRATELGYVAYNVLEGFEGDPNEHAHRNTIGGWRACGFLWKQN